jgi:hypothetical protein
MSQEFSVINLHDIGYNAQINLINSKLDVEEIQTIRMLVNAHLVPGVLYKERGNTERSIHHLKIALELTKKCDHDESLRKGETSDHFGMLYGSQLDFASAKLHYSTELEDNMSKRWESNNEVGVVGAAMQV